MGVVLLRPQQRLMFYLWGAYQWFCCLCVCDARFHYPALRGVSRKQTSEVSIWLPLSLSFSLSLTLLLFFVWWFKVSPSTFWAFFKQGATTVSMPRKALVDPMQSSPEMDINKPAPSSISYSPSLPNPLLSYTPLPFEFSVSSPFTLKCQ